MNAIVVDVGARLVRRDGTEIVLAPKAFDLLLILVRNRPNAVSHNQLHDALWPGVHVSDTSLPALVTQLRKALGDTSADGRVIRTLHRVGYAFIGDAVVAEQASVTTPVYRLMWRGQTFDIPDGESIVGRDRGCAVHIDADSVSRQHARLKVVNGEVVIEDLGSKNGTWVNGEQIQGVVPLAPGTSFRLGSETMRVELATDDRSTRTVVS